MNFNKKIFLILLVIFALGFFLRFYKLEKQSFIADEYLGVNISYGYFKTGQWKFWDFNNEELTNEEYTRSNIYYWQVAQVFNFLDLNERTARLISVVWGLVGMALVFFATYYFTKKISLALLAVFLLSVSISALIFDRKLRMYSMFAPVYFAFSVSIFKFLESQYGGKIRWLKNICNKINLNLPYLLVVLFLGVVSFRVHLLTINIIPVLFVFLFILMIYDLKKKKKIIKNKYLWLLSLFFIFLIPFASSHYFKDALTFFSPVFHWTYIEKITLDYSYILIAFVFLLSGCYFLIKKYGKFGLWITLSFLVPLLLAIFLWDRSAGSQYIYLVEDFKIIIYASGIYFISKILAAKKIFYFSRKSSFLIFLIFFIIISINFSFFFSKDSFYHSIKKWDYPNYREAYNYYLKHKKGQSVIITRNLDNYYLRGSHSNTIHYGDTNKLTLNKIKNAQANYDSVWAIYTKDYYFRKDVTEYLDNNFELIEASYTNKDIKIWRWEKEDQGEDTED